MCMDRRNNLHFFDGDDYATHSEKWTLILFSGEEKQMPLDRLIELSGRMFMYGITDILAT